MYVCTIVRYGEILKVNGGGKISMAVGVGYGLSNIGGNIGKMIMHWTKRCLTWCLN